MNIINSQPPNCIELAIRILSWLVKSRKVLTVHALQLALAVDPDRTGFDELDLHDLTTMLDVCASLITYDENTTTIRLAHYTIQEYLLNHPKIHRHADLKVAMSCLKFLSDERFMRLAIRCIAFEISFLVLCLR
jgi:hypothetical protein